MSYSARTVVLAAVLCATSVVQARAATVLADRILTGHAHEFVPRYAACLPSVLIVPAGQTVTLPPESTWDAIEVAGTLRVARDRDTIVRFIHLTILPGGTLDAGTTADPVLAGVRFVIRNVPIDTAKDPYQFGNGIINFGRQTRVGRAVTSFTELTEDAEAGATRIRLDVPGDWRVGDELLLPDMGQITRDRPIRRESPVFIAAIVPGAITLTKPLDFEHRSITDPAGAVRIRPRVANLTRNIVIASEDPRGARGHTINIGHHASWDIRYNVLSDVGRTRNVPLDNTVADDTGRVTHVGTNQFGRYASHDHHTHGHGGAFVGNVLHGSGVTKWGHVVHGTHDTLVESNIALDFPGAGFVTEDGYEVRNIFRRNVAAFSTGNMAQASTNASPRGNCPGCEGSGFWFHGLEQTIERNEAWNNYIGLNLFAMFQVLGQSVPREPGGAAEVKYDPRSAVPISVADNVTLSNTETGHELWGTRRFPLLRAIAAHNGMMQVRAGQSGLDVWLKDPTMLATGGVSTAVSSGQPYVASLEVDGGLIAGCQQAFSGGGAHDFVRIRNITLQCVTNIDFSSRGFAEESLYENVRHLPYGSHPRRFIVLGSGRVWQPGQPVYNAAWNLWMPARGSRHLIRNWQGTGVDYRLYQRQQLSDAPAWPASDAPGTEFYCPEAGLTMGECWERYGLAYGGEAIAREDATELEGLVNAIARPGLDVKLGIPRAVLATPNRLAPAPLDTFEGRPSVRMRLLLTGDPARATREAIVQIDGGKPSRYSRTQGQMEDEVAFHSRAVGEGTHTVRTWRENKKGDRIPESELVFQYTVAAPQTAQAGQ